jgi:uncharacterized protein YndB with AHSA1/START domain
VGDYAILMQIDVAADPAAVHAALETEAGIASWWSSRTSLTDGPTGGRLEVGFPAVPLPFDFAVHASAGRVEWVTGGFPPPWAATTVRFDIASNPEGPGTRLLFGHLGFTPDDPQVPSVSFTWAQILLRLKAYAETGLRQPFFGF